MIHVVSTSLFSSQSHWQGLRLVGMHSVNPQPWHSPIIALDSFTHTPSLFACFNEIVSCVYAFFSGCTCLSIFVARAACFGFCSISITTFLLSFFLFYKFHVFLFLFLQIPHMSQCLLMYTYVALPIWLLYSSSVCISICQIYAYVYHECHLVHALSSSSKFICNYHHIHMYICNDYCVVNTYNLNIPNIIRLCTPTSKGVAQCLFIFHAQGPLFNIPTCQYFLSLLIS